MALFAACGIEKSAHEWQQFVVVEGQPYPVPQRWVATEGGRYAHSIKLPDALPKPVPFNFTTARLKSLLPWHEGTAEQYWRHLCDTESGQYIFRTIDNVDGLVFMRLSPLQLADGSDPDEDPWLYEAAAVEYGLIGRDADRLAGHYINAPWATYLQVEFPELSGTAWRRVSRTGNEPLDKPDPFADRKWRRDRIDAPTERYALIWRGLRRPHDREYLISGHEWFVLDRYNNSVLAVLRDFAHAFPMQRSSRGFNWRFAPTCAKVRDIYDDASALDPMLLAQRVLKPAVPGTSLQSNDARALERMKRRRK